MNELIPTTRNRLKIGDKIRLNNGKVLTVKGLDFSVVYVTESVFAISKKDIETILTPVEKQEEPEGA